LRRSEKSTGSRAEATDSVSGGEIAPGAERPRCAEGTLTALPRRGSRVAGAPVLAGEFVERRRDHGRDRGDLVGRRAAAEDPDVGARVLGGHSGMFPCFFGGWEARLVRSARRALTI